MTTSNEPEKSGIPIAGILRILVLVLVFGWSLIIIQPFYVMLVWSFALSIAAYPVYLKLLTWTHGKHTLSAVICTALMLLCILTPLIYLSESLYTTVGLLKTRIDSGLPLIPPPASYTEQWPAMLDPLVRIWQMASDDLGTTLSTYAVEVSTAGKWLFGQVTDMGLGMFEVLISTIISGILLRYSEPTREVFMRFFDRIGGKRGLYYYQLSVMTVRNVLYGIIGVALIQTGMAAIAIIIADIPYAALWITVCLVLNIAQIGVLPVALFTAIYVFNEQGLWAGLIFSAWMLLITVADNMFKPLLLGRNSPVPSLVVFLGSIGGFLVSGFTGLFMGALFLSMSYKITADWLSSTD